MLIHATGLRNWVLTATLLLALVICAGCYRKEISRRGYTGFQIETGAEPPPRAQQADYPGYKPFEPEKSDPLADLFSPVTGLFRAVGEAFEPDASPQGNYTPPQSDGVPHRPLAESSDENITLFPPDATEPR